MPPNPLRPIRALLPIWAMLAGAAPASAQGVEVDPCSELARAAERRDGLPAGLVQAVALAESGRWLGAGGGGRAWPWTITSGQDSYYLPSRVAAVAKARELKAQGRTNIDVGCMQVNLGYHGHAFGSLEVALDPAANVAYGAGFLKRLRAETGSWALAIAYYHNRDPARGGAYQARVYRLWHDLRHGPAAPRTVQLAGPRARQEKGGEVARVLSFGVAERPSEAIGPAGPSVLRGR